MALDFSRIFKPPRMESNGVTENAARKNKEGILLILQGVVGAGDRDRTGDVQLGKLAFYR
jgi:hypothetical protein